MEKQIKMKVKIGEKHFLVELGQEVVITKELIKAMPDKFEVENELKFERGKVYTILSMNKWTGIVKEIMPDRIIFHQILCHNDKYYDTRNAFLLNTNIRSFYLATPEEIALLEEADRKHGLEFNPVTMELEELPKDGEVWTFEYEDGAKNIARIEKWQSLAYFSTKGVIYITGRFSAVRTFTSFHDEMVPLKRKYKGGDEELAEAAKKAGKVWDENKKEYVDIEPLFVTEDGIKMYDTRDCVSVNINTFKITASPKGFINSNTKTFSTKEAAAKWVVDNKSKSFEDYEKEFYSGMNHMDVEHLLWLEKNYPKQYCQIIGQFIADDLNGDEKPDNTSSISEYIVCWNPKTGFYIDDYGAPKRGHIRFATKEIGNKFLEIMGDKLAILY